MACLLHIVLARLCAFALIAAPYAGLQADCSRGAERDSEYAAVSASGAVAASAIAVDSPQAAGFPLDCVQAVGERNASETAVEQDDAPGRRNDTARAGRLTRGFRPAAGPAPAARTADLSAADSRYRLCVPAGMRRSERSGCRLYCVYRI